MSTLDQIRQREAAATKGPWKARGLQSSTAILDGSDKVLASLGDPLSGYNWKAAEFIAEARTDMPRLLATVDAVLALHSKRVEQAVFGDCAAEMCDHDDECPTEPFDVCAACWVAAEEVDQYFMEGQIHTAAYPCRTVRAITEALEGDK